MEAGDPGLIGVFGKIYEGVLMKKIFCYCAFFFMANMLSAEIVMQTGFGYVHSIQFYENGKTVAIWHQHPETYLFDKKSGRLIDGEIEAIWINETATLPYKHWKAKIKFINNVLIDQTVKWYLNGQLMRVENYKNEVLDGKFEEYYETSGSKKYEGRMNKGKFEGPMIYYSKDGKPEKIISRREGKRFKQEFSTKVWWKKWLYFFQNHKCKNIGGIWDYENNECLKELPEI